MRRGIYTIIFGTQIVLTIFAILCFQYFHFTALNFEVDSKHDVTFFNTKINSMVFADSLLLIGIVLIIICLMLNFFFFVSKDRSYKKRKILKKRG